MTERVSIVEVGPRDGLQNEKELVPVEDKIKLVNRLSECGFDSIEVTSFVSPKWVPQLADAAQVMAGIRRYADVSYAVLVPNLKGYQLAKAAGANEVAIFAAASEGFSQNNINCSIEQSIERFIPVLAQADHDGVPVRGYLSCVVNCPYEGDVDPVAVAKVAGRLSEMGCYEISLGDTTGQGRPETISTMLEAVLNVVPANKLAGHYHDTNARALENIEVSLEKGLRRFDAAIGGLGGCPYAPGAKGNVATHDVIHLLGSKGYQTSVDELKLDQALELLHSIMERL